MRTLWHIDHEMTTHNSEIFSLNREGGDITLSIYMGRRGNISLFI